MARVKEDQFIFIRRQAQSKSKLAKRKNVTISRINLNSSSIAHNDIHLDFAPEDVTSEEATRLAEKR